jgi:predicted amidohydrolase
MLTQGGRALFATALLLCMTALGTTARSASMAANLVPNPSFEHAAGEVPTAWTPSAPRPEISPAFALSREFAHSGEASLLMSGQGRAGVFGWVTAECAGVTPGRYYEAAVYVHTEDIATVHESVTALVTMVRDTQEALPRVAVLAAEREENGWRRLAVRVRAPQDATAARIFLSLRLAPHGRVWWDDVSLHEVPAPPPRKARLATSYLNRAARGPEAWREVLKTAGEGGADIVCLGELATVVPDDPNARPAIPGPATEVLAEYARQYHMMVVASLPEWQGPLRYNTAVLIGRDGHLIGRYRKTHLPEAEGQSGTTPGYELPVFDTDIGRIGLQVCYDHMFPEVSRILALKGAELIFTPIEGDIRLDGQVYESVARARAVDNSVYYVTSICDTGRSLIVDPAGRVLADTAQQLGVVFADVDLNTVYWEPWLSIGGDGAFQQLWPKERHPALYRPLLTDE